MQISFLQIVSLVSVALIFTPESTQSNQSQSALTFRLDSTEAQEIVNAKAEVVTYRGRRAVHLTRLPGHETGNESMVAMLTGPDFKDGTIEAEVAGVPRAGAEADMRGFIGILFRTSSWFSSGEFLFEADQCTRREPAPP